MAITNHERVGKALDLLKAGLAPFVEREVKNAYPANVEAQLALFLSDDRLLASRPMSEWDAAGLLKLMWSAWNDVFRRTLGHAEHSLMSALAFTFLGVSWSGGCPLRSRMYFLRGWFLSQRQTSAAKR